MNFKKLLSICLSTAVLYTAAAVFAISSDAGSVNALPRFTTSISANSPSDFQENQQAYFNSFTGVVKQIDDFPGIKGGKIIAVENTEGLPAHIIISDNTYIVDNQKITLGTTITGYYDATAPMILIYPPQYNAEVVVVEPYKHSLKVDRFDQDLLSADGLLKLNISKDTKILSQNGKPFKGELANRKLVVFYDFTTKSIPAQTSPLKIVVLSEKDEVTPPATEEKPSIFPFNFFKKLMNFKIWR